MSEDSFFRRAKLLLQYSTLILLILVDAAMLWFLVNGLVVKAEAQMDPAVSAIVGGLSGAITTAIAMAVRDLYQPGDEGRNGSTPAASQPTTPTTPTTPGG